MPEKNVVYIDIYRCLETLLKKKNVILLSGFICFFLALGVTIKGTPTLYSASATIYNTVSADTDMYQVQYTGSVISSYSDVASSMKVLDEAAGLVVGINITGEDLREIISVKASESSSIITISAVCEDPPLAVAAANAVATVFTQELNEITGKNIMRLLDLASEYGVERDGFIYVWIIRIIAFFLAAIFTSGVVLALDIFSTKVNTIRDATLRGEMDLLGMFPDIVVKAREEK